MTNGEHVNDDAERQRLNEIASEFARSQAKLAREKLISFACQAVRIFFTEDEEMIEALEAKDFPKGDSLGIYVLEDVIMALQRGDRAPITHTLLLVPDTEIGQTGDARLRLLVPIDEVTENGENEAEAENLPQEVYVEVTSREGQLTRYAIDKDGIYEYISAADTGEQVIIDDLHEDMWQRRASLRVDTGMSIVSQIQEDFINMRAIPQRIITVGETHPLDY